MISVTEALCFLSFETTKNFIVQLIFRSFHRTYRHETDRITDCTIQSKKWGINIRLEYKTNTYSSTKSTSFLFPFFLILVPFNFIDDEERNANVDKKEIENYKFLEPASSISWLLLVSNSVFIWLSNFCFYKLIANFSFFVVLSQM